MPRTSTCRSNSSTVRAAPTARWSRQRFGSCHDGPDRRGTGALLCRPRGQCGHGPRAPSRSERRGSRPARPVGAVPARIPRRRSRLAAHGDARRSPPGTPGRGQQTHRAAGRGCGGRADRRGNVLLRSARVTPPRSHTRRCISGRASAVPSSPATRCRSSRSRGCVSASGSATTPVFPSSLAPTLARESTSSPSPRPSWSARRLTGTTSTTRRAPSSRGASWRWPTRPAPTAMTYSPATRGSSTRGAGFWPISARTAGSRGLTSHPPT